MSSLFQLRINRFGCISDDTGEGRKVTSFGHDADRIRIMCVYDAAFMELDCLQRTIGPSYDAFAKFTRDDDLLWEVF